MKRLVRHIFSATKLKAATYPRIITKLAETLHFIYDPNLFPQNFVNILEIPSKTIQKLFINHQNIEIINCIAETQPFPCTNIPENTNTSLEASRIENMNTIFHSQPSEIRMNKTTETDVNSTLLDEGILFSSPAVNTLIDLEDNDQNNNQNNKNNTNNISTTDNTHIYQNHQHRQPVNSTELTQNSDPINTTIPILPNISTPLPFAVYTDKIQYILIPNLLFLIIQPNPHRGLTKKFKYSTTISKYC